MVRPQDSKPPPAGSDAGAIAISLPAEHRYLNVLHACIAALLEQTDQPVDQQNLAHIRLAVQEVGANIVNHAYRESWGEGLIEVRITLSHDPLTMRVETVDQGAPFDPTQIPVPELGTVQAGGYGLFLTRKALDYVSYTAGEGHTWESTAGSDWILRAPQAGAGQQPAGAAPPRNRWRLVKHL